MEYLQRYYLYKKNDVLNNEKTSESNNPNQINIINNDDDQDVIDLEPEEEEEGENIALKPQQARKKKKRKLNPPASGNNNHSKSGNKINMPFIIIHSKQASKINCRMTSNKDKIHLILDNTFEVLDDSIILDHMNLINEKYIPATFLKYLPYLGQKKQALIASNKTLEQLSNQYIEEQQIKLGLSSSSSTTSSSTSTTSPSQPNKKPNKILKRSNSFSTTLLGLD